MLKIIRCYGAISLFVLSGCEQLGSDTQVEAVSSRTDQLYFTWYSNLWQSRDIPVCWETPGNDAEKAIIHEVLVGQRSWAAAGDVNFVQFSDCVDAQAGIHVSFSDGSPYTTRLGPGSGGEVVGIFLNAADRWRNPSSGNWNVPGRCQANSLGHADCQRAVALHEFGHAIGFSHEQNRPDTDTTVCTEDHQGENGVYTFGNWDAQSIMNYCNPPAWLSSQDRSGAAFVYGPRIGLDTRLHDYDADGRVDLLCHDRVGGGKSLLLADTSGHYGTRTWSRSTSWCAGDTTRLLVGDYTGGGSEDLLCFDTSTGTKLLDSSAASTYFTGTNWSTNSDSFCRGEDRELFFFDANNDGHDDLVCFDRAAGAVWADYYTSASPFSSVDLVPELNPASPFCTSRLYVGDFDGDGAKDLMCFDAENGTRNIDYAGDGLGYSGWSQSTSWCTQQGRDLLIGDFNGDHHDDLLCRDTTTGTIWIDYADAAGQFISSNYTRVNTWCTFNEGRVFVGDVNGDQRDDLVCHNMVTGQVWVDYASSSGALAGTDWTSSLGFCTAPSAELH